MSLIFTMAFIEISSVGPKLLSLRQELGTYENYIAGTVAG